MKKIIPLLFAILIANFTNGQITTPIVKANFGVDADLSSNYFNGAPQPAVDDWFSNGYPGTGQFMIDTTGAAAILAGYISNPGTRSLSFSRLMKYAPYTVLNNRLLLDAVFHRDFHGNDSTVFASGSNKNGMSPVNWSCPVSQGIPDKNDILDAFSHVRRAGPNVTDSLWMFNAVSIENTTGSRYFDFELYQTDFYYDRPTQTFNNYGPDAGHTSWKFNAAGNVTTPGDIIFTAEFGGSSLTLIEARIWIKKTDLSITPTSFSWGGQFDGDGAAAVYGYASIIPKTAGNFYAGVPCVANTWAGAFKLVRVDNSIVTNYIANQFLEFSVNLTKLGLDPGNTLGNPCGNPFRRVMIKTRSSSSFSSELKDFIAPFRMFDYPQVDISTYITYFCFIMPPTTISVVNPISTSTYTWSTPNGHISGPTTGTSILVDSPGTYRVVQRLYSQCPLYAQDSVVILFSKSCYVLDVNLLNFTVNKVNNNAVLQWQASNNKDAAVFVIEYSFDNRNFKQLAEIPAKNITDLADYSFSYPYSTTLAPVIYYRIRLTGKNGSTLYSNIASLRISDSGNSNGVVFPNPSGGELWLSMNAAFKETAYVYIWDVYGKMITNSKIEIYKGENLLKIHDLSGKPKGTYLVKVKSANGDITQKVLLMN